MSTANASASNGADIVGIGHVLESCEHADSAGSVEDAASAEIIMSPSGGSEDSELVFAGLDAGSPKHSRSGWGDIAKSAAKSTVWFSSVVDEFLGQDAAADDPMRSSVSSFEAK